MGFLFPSPDYERSSHPRRARIFMALMIILSVLIVGGTLILNWRTLTIDDILAMVAPFVIMFFVWLFVIWMRRETGVKWIPLPLLRSMSTRISEPDEADFFVR